MLPECGISTQKWPEIWEKGPQRSLEIVSWFPEYISQFPEYISRFPEYISQFPEYISRFPEYISRFPEIISRFPEIISLFPEIVSPFPKSGQDILFHFVICMKRRCWKFYEKCLSLFPSHSFLSSLSLFLSQCPFLSLFLFLIFIILDAFSRIC